MYTEAINVTNWILKALKQVKKESAHTFLSIVLGSLRIFSTCSALMSSSRQHTRSNARYVSSCLSSSTSMKSFSLACGFWIRTFRTSSWRQKKRGRARGKKHLFQDTLLQQLQGYWATCCTQVNMCFQADLYATYPAHLQGRCWWRRRAGRQALSPRADSHSADGGETVAE